jgi:hypothetical protein
VAAEIFAYSRPPSKNRATSDGNAVGISMAMRRVYVNLRARIQAKSTESALNYNAADTSAEAARTAVVFETDGARLIRAKGSDREDVDGFQVQR